MFGFGKMIEKPVIRTRRTVVIEDSMVNETWTAFHGIGQPVTYFEYVEEPDQGAKRFMYRVTLEATQDEWDRLNRRLGALGISEVPTDEKKK